MCCDAQKYRRIKYKIKYPLSHNVITSINRNYNIDIYTSTRNKNWINNKINSSIRILNLYFIWTNSSVVVIEFIVNEIIRIKISSRKLINKLLKTES